jgi:hypothetical protein
MFAKVAPRMIGRGATPSSANAFFAFLEAGVVLERGEKLEDVDSLRSIWESARFPAVSLRIMAASAYARILCALSRFDEVLALHAGPLPRRVNLFEADGLDRLRLNVAIAHHALGHVDEARRAIDEARKIVLERAARIDDDEVRRSFLERVEVRRDTLRLAREWLGEHAPR